MPLSKCHVCGGNIIQKTVSTENWWGDAFTIVEGVPAFVCENCGEQYFDAETSLMLDKIIGESCAIYIHKYLKDELLHFQSNVLSYW